MRSKFRIEPSDPNQGDISAEALAQLGDGQIAYVKTIRSEDVHALFPQVPRCIEPGHEAVRAARRRRHADHADRQPRSGDRQCLSQELEMVSVH